MQTTTEPAKRIKIDGEIADYCNPATETPEMLPGDEPDAPCAACTVLIGCTEPHYYRLADGEIFHPGCTG